MPAGHAESGPGSVAEEGGLGTVSLLTALDRLFSSCVAGQGE